MVSSSSDRPLVQSLVGWLVGWLQSSLYDNVFGPGPPIYLVGLFSLSHVDGIALLHVPAFIDSTWLVESASNSLCGL